MIEREISYWSCMHIYSMLGWFPEEEKETEREIKLVLYSSHSLFYLSRAWKLSVYIVSKLEEFTTSVKQYEIQL